MGNRKDWPYLGWGDHEGWSLCVVLFSILYLVLGNIYISIDNFYETFLFIYRILLCSGLVFYLIYLYASQSYRDGPITRYPLGKKTIKPRWYKIIEKIAILWVILLIGGIIMYVVMLFF